MTSSKVKSNLTTVVIKCAKSEMCRAGNGTGEGIDVDVEMLTKNAPTTFELSLMKDRRLHLVWFGRCYHYASRGWQGDERTSTGAELKARKVEEVRNAKMEDRLARHARGKDKR